MTRLFLFLILAAAIPAETPRGFPFEEGETLRYQVKLPEGGQIGDATFTARRLPGTAAMWELVFELDASVPGFEAKDRFRSLIHRYCSLEFEKESVHGRRKVSESTVFDPDSRAARRTTKGGGGTSEIALGGCGRDALAFLYFTRKELGQGRVAPAETVVFGAGYQVRLRYTGEETVQGKTADRVDVTAKGPASEHAISIAFARDAARTPLLIRVPLPGGTFTMELAE
ncbi:MAG: DUF3108 domain-containing protein [Bryobacterales bacterium]|nr:DUF3108 domain-containing protein [Bryobacterales bacterium]